MFRQQTSTSKPLFFVKETTEKPRRPGDEARVANGANDRTALVGILIVGGLAHFVLLLTDYQIWDAWWIWRGLTIESDFPHLVAFNAEWARPLDLWLYWFPFAKLFGWSEAGVVACKVFGFVCWVGAGPMINLWLRRGLLLEVPAAFAVACLSVGLPLFDVMGDITYAMYSSSVFLFWAAFAFFSVRLAGDAACGSSAPRHWTARLVCLALFFLAFNLNSTLMFYYAVGLAAFVYKNPLLPRCLLKRGIGAIKVWPDFVALPVAYFVGKQWLFPQSGHYADYNRPSLDPQRLADGGASFFGFLRDEVIFAGSSPVGVIFSIIVAVVVLAVVSRNKKWMDFWQTPELTCDWKLVLVGIGMLLAAWFPYASVGQIFSADGYTSRNTILMSVPLGMILFGVMRPVVTAFCRSRSWIFVGFLSFILSLCVFANSRVYLALQAFGAKQEAVARTLERANVNSEAVVIQLRDYFPLGHSINYYPPSIWTFLLARSLPAARTFVVDTRPFAQDEIVTNPDGSQSLRVPFVPIDAVGLRQLKESTTIPRFFAEIPSHGKQMLAVVSPGSLGTDAEKIGVKYLTARLLSRSKLEQLIESVASVRVQDVPDVGSGYP